MFNELDCFCLDIHLYRNMCVCKYTFLCNPYNKGDSFLYNISLFF